MYNILYGLGRLGVYSTPLTTLIYLTMILGSNRMMSFWDASLYALTAGTTQALISMFLLTIVYIRETMSVTATTEEK